MNDGSEECIGRFKLCSKSLVFNPRESSMPIIKIAFKECTEIRQVEPGEAETVKCKSKYE